MKRLVLAAFAALACASPAFAAAPDCVPIPGAEQLWADPAKRIVLVGEMHGTEDIPAAFGDLVCAAAATGRPVIVGLEFMAEAQPKMNAFLASSGDDAARAALMDGLWISPMQDGRTSRAMLALIERLRVMKAAGELAEVQTFVATYTSASNSQTHEQGMADAWMRAAASRPDAVVLVLVGQVHAMKTRGLRDYGYDFAAMLVPPEQTIALRGVTHGGEAWNCQQDACGPHPLNAEDNGQRRVAIRPIANGVYDGVLATGKTNAASPPAAQQKPQA